jgi:hypothetical protein
MPFVSIKDVTAALNGMQSIKRSSKNAKERASCGARSRRSSLRADVQRLSSINEVLLAESAALRSRLGDQKVVALKSPTMVPRAPLAG